MRIEAVCFTQAGQRLGERLILALSRGEDPVSLTLTRCGGDGPTVGDWVSHRFRTGGALLFIGAAGIAVRAIAPLVGSKATDPAVVVVDQQGRFVIPLLSGHMGGANALAVRLAQLLGAQAVLTTATDLEQVWAVDTWAVQGGYLVHNPGAIKAISSRLLAGEPVGLYSAYPIRGTLPPGVVAAGEETADLLITPKGGTHPRRLWLIPRDLVLGVGCRRGTGEEALEAAFRDLCRDRALDPRTVAKVCSIHLKKDEPGLLAFCRTHGWPLETYSAQELAQAPGTYTASPFVARTTGVDNVCERSAVVGSGGQLLVQKTARDGVTMAVARRPWVVEV